MLEVRILLNLFIILHSKIGKTPIFSEYLVFEAKVWVSQERDLLQKL